MFKFADQPQTISEVLIDSIDIYKQTFLRVWYWSAVIPILSALPVFILGSKDKAAALSGGQVVFMIFIMLIAAFVISLLLHRIYLLVTKDNPDISESISLARNKWLTVFLAMLITGVLSFVGFMFFIIPGVFLSILFMFYMPYILFEGDGVVDSIKNSCKLVWGSWWFTFVVLFLPTLMLVVATSFFTLLMGKDVEYGSTIFDMVLVTIFTPFIQSVILVQFNNLKLQRKAD